MAEVLHVHQHVAVAQHLDDVVIGFPHLLTGEQLGIRLEHPARINGIDHRQVVFCPDFKVLLAVTRCRMNVTGTSVGGDVLTQDHRHAAIVERMPCPQVLQG